MVYGLAKVAVRDGYEDPDLVALFVEVGDQRRGNSALLICTVYLATEKGGLYAGVSHGAF
jgi:hypothetical protein